jgi:hypothetical protein
MLLCRLVVRFRVQLVKMSSKITASSTLLVKVTGGCLRALSRINAIKAANSLLEDGEFRVPRTHMHILQPFNTSTFCLPSAELSP